MFLYCCLLPQTVSANSSYQVDLIIFAKHPTFAKHREIDSPFVPVGKEVIKLKKTGLYQLLAPSDSSLKNEYYLLTHKSKYRILANYSWRQPKNNQSSIAIPNIKSQGWNIKGRLRIVQTNFYALEAELQCASPQNPQAVFTVIQKQRLLPDTVYYLDNPQVRMLIKIHV
ncbi:MAG: hypothetical protein H0U75_10995 [Legionella sp.]|nr:hypothetical protein [Legionella sp.]